MTQKDENSETSVSQNVDRLVLQMCWDEYKLLQDKIDKIGTFKFQVKGWSATLVVAATVGGKAIGAAWFVYLWSFLVIFAFLLVEENQSIRGAQYGNRAHQLETRIGHLLSGSRYRPGACAASILNKKSIGVYRHGLTHLVGKIHNKWPGAAMVMCRWSTAIFYGVISLIPLIACVVSWFSSSTEESQAAPETRVVISVETIPVTCYGTGGEAAKASTRSTGARNWDRENSYTDSVGITWFVEE